MNRIPLDIEFPERAGTKHIDQGHASQPAFETAEIIFRQDHRGLFSMHGDVLRPLRPRMAHHVAETRFGIL